MEHVELKDLQPKRDRSSSQVRQLGTYQPAVDAGHLALFSAAPRAPAPEQVVVVAASAPNQAPPAAAEDRQQPNALASASGQQVSDMQQGQDPKQLHPLMAADARPKGGSNGSLDSLADGPGGCRKGWGRGSDAGSEAGQARSGNKQHRWPWQPRWKEPRLLPVPVSPDCQPDDMHMSLTIGPAQRPPPLLCPCFGLKCSCYRHLDSVTAGKQIFSNEMQNSSQ